jgi:ubiquinone/menaquinone biosynthesis C-methylase UbiE
MNPSDNNDTGSSAERWNMSLAPFQERSNYKSVWDRQAKEMGTAMLAVAGHADEGVFESTAHATVTALRQTVGVYPLDIILEIGCGIARVGRVLSSSCLHWIGTDISGKMLEHAAVYLERRPNTSLVELSSVGLREIHSDVIDLVYCTIVFMHLYEWDRFTYVQEAFRVLRPGGRCFFDNVGLNSEAGWAMFREGAAYPADQRPAHLSVCSTREELGIYLARAGFEDIRIHEFPNGQIAATGRKPNIGL